MERNAYHHYRILDHVEQSPRVTNRLIAGKLGVSVRLAHELLSGLVQRGLLHVRKLHSRRWDYFLTPTGIAEKARLTYEFLDFTMQFYREARRRSADALRRASAQGIHNIAFLGMTELAEIASLGAQEWGLRVVDVFDDRRAGDSFLGVRIRPVADLADSRAERIVVTAFDPADPMGRRYLPAGMAEQDRFLWIFDLPPGERKPTPAASGEAAEGQS
jgi:DNA-binding MarR family transcriptional regulator